MGWAAAVAGTCWSLCLHFLESAGCPEGGGLYTDGSFSQKEESTVTFENCTASRASVASGSPLGNDVWGS